MTRELLQQALEALECCYSEKYDGAKYHGAKAAIRAHLAQPVQPQGGPAPMSEAEIQDLRDRAIEMLEQSFPSTKPDRNPTLICNTCGADRLVSDCKGERMKCPVAGIASGAPERKPMTDEQVSRIVKEAASGAAIRRDGTTSQRIVRAVEAFHGIKGKP